MAEKVIELSLFDLLFQKTDDWRETLIEGREYNIGKVYMSSISTVYYKAVNKVTQDLFYGLCGDETIVDKKPPYDISVCGKFAKIKVEFHINTEVQVDLSKSDLYCIKMKSNPNAKWKALQKPLDVGGNVLSMFISMVKAVIEDDYEGYYWACSEGSTIRQDTVKLSGTCSSNTVKLYLDDTAWPYIDTISGDQYMWWRSQHNRREIRML